MTQEPALATGDAQQEDTESPDRAESSELFVEDLAVGYPTTDAPVLNCETVVLPAGEVTALVGPNGSGKSTLLKTMADQLDPQRGTVRLDGTAIDQLPPAELARNLGILAQDHTAPDRLTVEDLVTHGRYPHRSTFAGLSSADYAAIDQAIDLAGVADLRDQPVGQLSGGQRQLAWIAMVLAQDTDVLLLDEPTTHLDLHHQLRVLDVVHRLNRTEGITVGVVLHDIGQAARFADNLIALKDGQVYDWGPPTEVVTDRLLAEVFAVDARVELDGEHGPAVIPLTAVEED